MPRRSWPENPAAIFESIACSATSQGPVGRQGACPGSPKGQYHHKERAGKPYRASPNRHHHPATQAGAPRNDPVDHAADEFAGLSPWRGNLAPNIPTARAWCRAWDAAGTSVVSVTPFEAPASIAPHATRIRLRTYPRRSLYRCWGGCATSGTTGKPSVPRNAEATER